MAKLNQTQVSELYVLLFNMASEGDGNEYWQGISEERDTATLIDDMLYASRDHAVDLDLLNAREFVETLYQNAYGSVADEEGIAYWTEQLQSGELNKGGVVWNILEAVKEEKTDEVDLANQQTFFNRVEVSNYFADNQSEKVGNDEQGFGEGQALAGVTDDINTVAAAKSAIDALGEGGGEPVDPVDPSNPGDTFLLDVTRDIVEGTAGDDTFLATLAQNALGQQVNTLGSGDTINGGAGFDTLEAHVTAGAHVSSGATSNMAIAPITKGVENIVLQTDSADVGVVDTVYVNAKYMEGVNKIASNHSDASLVVQNMTSKGVAGGTANMTVGMEYTGNADTVWDEADMTVYFDQDYLTRSVVSSNSLYYFTQDRLATQLDDKPFGPNTAVNGLSFALNDERVAIVIPQEELEAFLLGNDRSYAGFTALLQKALAETNAEMNGALDGFSISLDTTFVRTNGGQNNQGDPLDMPAPAIALTAPDDVVIELPRMNQNAQNLPTYDMYNDVADEQTVSNTPARINVDLEKVGLAADGGELVIGSMNKNSTNSYVFNQDATVTDTVAGFDELNVNVAGGKELNSSLSGLHSTNNSLRKVTIDSKDGGNANLTIGNSNTSAVLGSLGSSAAANAQAFKDVQVMDASGFNGDLTLSAGITGESSLKYLANYEGVALYGLHSARNELAAFDYQGGNGNDVLNIQIDGSIIDQNLDGALADLVGGATDTNGFNVFQMNIDGGAGHDLITVGMDAASTSTGLLQGATNITIDGGLGNDVIDLDSAGFGANWTYTVAFSGTHFGHDTIIGFNDTLVTVSDEVQTLDLTGFVAHADERIVVTVGDKALAAYNVTATQADTDIATIVADMLDGSQANYSEVFFDAATETGALIDLQRTGLDQKRVTVEIQQYDEATGTWSGDNLVHSATSEVLFQGGLLGSATGGDVLDFSSYNAKGVTVEGGTAYTENGYVLAAGDVVVDMVLDVHSTVAGVDVYNVFIGSTAIGSIEFVGGFDDTAIDANSFVFA